MGSLDPSTIVLITLAGSFLLFVTDALRYDAVAILVVLILAGTGVLSAEDAFSGFASPAVVLVAAMYAFAAAIGRTGVTEIIGQKILGGERPSEARLAFRVVLVSGLLSSVLSNAAVVATLIPVLGTVARRAKIPVSRLLIPLSFGSLLGGLLTVIGTSKNIAVNGVIEHKGGVPFALFDFTIYGFCLLLIGALFFLGPGRKLLPKPRQRETLTEHFHVPKFVTEVLVEPSSDLINRTVGETGLVERFGITLLGIIRSEREPTLLAPGPYNRIRQNDVLMLQGESEAILRFREELRLKERRSVNVGEALLVADDVQLVEAVVPAASSLVGRSLSEASFRDTTHLNVLAISKHGETHPSKISDTQLEVGDSLLLQGHARDIHRVAESRELIVLVEHDVPDFGRKAMTAIAILGGVLLCAALTAIPISVAALGGALALVLTRCIRPDHVRQGIDWSVLILIGGMLALGKAFDEHGLSRVVADWMRGIGGVMDSPTFVLGLLMLTTMLLTQVINHITAAVIMTPVAMEIALQLGMSDRAFLMAVIVGAEFAFMSPVAHQANAMVMGPGDYRYRDFLRVGTPLSILLLIIATLLLPVFWPV